MVFVWLERGVAFGIPAQLHPAFFKASGHTAGGDGFVALDIAEELLDKAEDRFDETLNGAHQPGAVARQAHRQIGHPRPGRGEGEDDADQQIDQQIHHHDRQRLGGLPGHQARRQHFQPQTAGAQQQAHRGFVAGQQLQPGHRRRKLLRQIGQLTRATAQALGELVRVLKDFRELTEAVPHPDNRRPASGQQPITGRGNTRLRPLRFEACPLIA
ncbi:hypothetical protein D3C84_572130 [compost metagenome]